MPGSAPVSPASASAWIAADRTTWPRSSASPSSVPPPPGTIDIATLRRPIGPRSASYVSSSAGSAIPRQTQASFQPRSNASAMAVFMPSTAARRHSVSAVADEEGATVAHPARDLGRERERIVGEDLDFELRPVRRLADHGDEPLGRERRRNRGFVHPRRQRDREDEPIVRAARDEDPGRALTLEHVEAVDRPTENVAEVGPEQDAEELAEVVRPLHRDPERRADRAPVPVGADEVARADGREVTGNAVAHDRPHTVGVLLERDELGREADVATERPEVIHEDRLEVVLRAHRRGGRADRRGLRLGRKAQGRLQRRRIVEMANRGLAWDHPPAAAADRFVDPPAAEDLHRANADACRAREDRGRRVPLDDDRLDAVSGEADRGDEPGRPGSDDEDRDVDLPSGPRALQSPACRALPNFVGQRVHLSDSVSDEVGLSTWTNVNMSSAPGPRPPRAPGSGSSTPRGRRSNAGPLAPCGSTRSPGSPACRARPSTCCTARGRACSTPSPAISATSRASNA